MNPFWHTLYQLGHILKNTLLHPDGSVSRFFPETYRYSNWLPCLKKSAESDPSRHGFCESEVDSTTWKQFLDTAEEYVRRSA